jgi:hypothetical protein
MILLIEKTWILWWALAVFAAVRWFRVLKPEPPLDFSEDGATPTSILNRVVDQEASDVARGHSPAARGVVVGGDAFWRTSELTNLFVSEMLSKKRRTG